MKEPINQETRKERKKEKKYVADKKIQQFHPIRKPKKKYEFLLPAPLVSAAPTLSRSKPMDPTDKDRNKQLKC
jgi:hypothetical protein